MEDGFNFLQILIILLQGFWSINFVIFFSFNSSYMIFVAAFQNVSSPKVTASKLMTNFLHIRPKIADRVKKQSPTYIEDIVVVMDGSGSVNSCEFDKGKKALKYMMGLASTGGSDAKYAAVTFGTSASINFNFLPYDTAANEIITIPYPSGSTNTQAGLAEAKKLFDDPSSGNCLYL